MVCLNPNYIDYYVIDVRGNSRNTTLHGLQISGRLWSGSKRIIKSIPQGHENYRKGRSVVKRNFLNCSRQTICLHFAAGTIFPMLRMIAFPEVSKSLLSI